jgi:CheY-like chemotaxis protein
LPGGDTVKIVALTASALKEEEAPIFAAGCDDVLRKPYRHSDVFAFMARHLNVRYCYGAPVDVARIKNNNIGAADLARVPATLCQDLRQAALQLDDQAMLALLPRLRPHHAALADALQDLVLDFRFDTILEWCEQIPMDGSLS